MMDTQQQQEPAGTDVEVYVTHRRPAAGIDWSGQYGQSLRTRTSRIWAMNNNAGGE